MLFNYINNRVNINKSRCSTLLMVVVLLMSNFICLSAQEGQNGKDFEPLSGLPGKDVKYVPTPQIVVLKMLEIAKVTSNDIVMDLGSGDGRTVISAAKRGARAIGIEYNPDLVVLSGRNAAEEGVSDRTEFIQGDLFEADLSQATVITMYLLPGINLRLRPILLDLKPGTRIVSNSHDMVDWIPDEAYLDIEVSDTFWKIYLWIIPAKVEGTWDTQQGELELSQKFQKVFGTLKKGKDTITILEGRLKGDQINFIANDKEYWGQVNGNSIKGTVKSGKKTSKWKATLTGN